ncbi:MAG: molybdopterin-dependent oxidoreductase [Firmicutes bacterium]|nr:molybdopterin-dependent oxidoreductase [Bacillota bacterium]
MRFRFPHKHMVITFLLLLLFVFIAGCACGPRKEILPGTFIIEGDALESKVYFTLEEIQSMEEGLIEADYFSLNSYGTKEYFHFKGIWLGYLLQEKVSLKDHASEVTFIAEDDYTVKLTLADILKEDYIDEQNPEIKHKVILAWEEDGREYDPQKGNPFQLVIGQREPGDVNKPYWVRNIRTIRID